MTSLSVLSDSRDPITQTQETLSEGNNSKNIEGIVRNEFAKLFQNPDFLAEVRSQIELREDPIAKSLALATLNRIVRIGDATETITTNIHDRLARFASTIENGQQA